MRVAHHGDCRDIIPTLGVVVDAVVTDPPYHLISIIKRFANASADREQFALKNPSPRFKALSTGFMGQQWDGGDLAFDPETWRVIGSALRPGGFLLAFGGTRTYHRMACAIEDAGFVIQDCIMWLYGSGFPKRRDMLKPAYENIIVAQKPYELRGVLCELRASLARMGMSLSGIAVITALSTVSSWLDTLDVYSAQKNTSIIGTGSSTTIDWKTLSLCLSEITPESITQAHSQGHLSIVNASPAIRFFDAELVKLRAILTPSAEGLATSSVPVERLDEAGVAYEPIVLAYRPGGKRTMQVDECRISTSGEFITAGHADTVRRGSLREHEGWTRPSHNTEQDAERRDRAIVAANTIGRWPANICHDGSAEVLAGFPEAVACKSPSNAKAESIYRPGQGAYQAQGPIYGDDGSAARFFYSAKAGAQDRWGSRHPTVKPVELMKWLVALVTPPGGTVLDPFAGSGTTGVAALATGRDCILIEREAEYIADIRERLAFYQGEGRHSLAVKARRVTDKPLGGLF